MSKKVHSDVVDAYLGLNSLLAEENKMKTFVILSEGPYGYIIQIFNSESKEEAEEFALTHRYTWPWFTITELDMSKPGLVFDSTGK